MLTSVSNCDRSAGSIASMFHQARHNISYKHHKHRLCKKNYQHLGEISLCINVPLEYSVLGKLDPGQYRAQFAWNQLGYYEIFIMRNTTICCDLCRRFLWVNSMIVRKYDCVKDLSNIIFAPSGPLLACAHSRKKAGSWDPWSKSFFGPN